MIGHGRMAGMNHVEGFTGIPVLEELTNSI
jgi:hypothetical protein